ncbi:MAG: hypothetical protein Q9227_002216 [Pyrenula ochraceoflavens]
MPRPRHTKRERSMNFLADQGLGDDAILQVDWRKGANTKDMIDAGKSFFQRSFDASEDTFNIANSKPSDTSLESFNKEGMLDSNGSTHMWVQPRAHIEKRLSLKRSTIFLLKLHVIFKWLLKQVDEDEADMSRSYMYKVSTAKSRKSGQYKIGREQAQVLRETLALQLGEHPWAVGVLPAPKGIFVLPQGWMLELEEVQNILIWRKDMDLDPLKRPSLRHRSFKEPTISNVPALTYSLMLRRKGSAASKLRGVVVTEHRSVLQGMLDRNASNNLFGDILWIATAGAPDLATREFLRLVVESGMVDERNVVWVSDHDPNGFLFFVNMKMGSRNSAWTSKITACPALRWKGPTVDDLRSIFDKWPRQEVERQRQIRDLSNSEERELLRKLEGKRDRRQINALEGSGAELHPMQKSLLSYFVKEGKWNLVQWDPELAAEVQSMKTTEKQSFSLFQVEAMDNCYLAAFFQQALNQWLTEPFEVPMPQISSSAAAFIASQPVAKEQAQASRNLRDIRQAMEA